jgi:hypothetical protein
VAEIFDVLDVEIGGFRFQGRGRHGRFPSLPFAA